MHFLEQNGPDRMFVKFVSLRWSLQSTKWDDTPVLDSQSMILHCLTPESEIVDNLQIVML